MNNLVERDLVASEIYFDNTGTAIQADNVNDAIVEIDNNFSWYHIPIGLSVRIKQYRQMVVDDNLLIEGNLIIEGRLGIV